MVVAATLAGAGLWPVVGHHRVTPPGFLFPDILFYWSATLGAGLVLGSILLLLGARRHYRAPAVTVFALGFAGSYLLGWPFAIELGRRWQGVDLGDAVSWCQRLIPLLEAEQRTTGTYPADPSRLEARLPPRPLRLHGRDYYELAGDSYRLWIDVPCAMPAIQSSWIGYDPVHRCWYYGP